MKSKLTSRKFWVAAVGVIMGIALAFGADGDIIESVAGAVTSLVSIVVYIMAEAVVDRADKTTGTMTMTTNYYGTDGAVTTEETEVEE